MAFHLFVWPRNSRDVRSLVRTLFINHCKWADVLVVRGRCFCSHKSCFRSNRVLENLLWNWSKTDRIAYKRVVRVQLLVIPSRRALNVGACKKKFASAIRLIRSSMAKFGVIQAGCVAM